MSANSKIEWTDATWNPIRFRLIEDVLIQLASGMEKIVPAGTWGYHCERVSPGCLNCYACAMNRRTLSAWGTGLDFTVPNRAKGEVYLDEEELLRPLKWRKPKTIFPGSMTDAFAAFVPDEFLGRMFAVAALTPQHRYLFLTKRADRMREYVGSLSDGFYAAESAPVRIMAAMNEVANVRAAALRWPLPNVWLGVSVEDQERKGRIGVLRGVPAAVRFLSLEPLLEDLGTLDLRGIDWVIVGGESGPGARPLNVAWARSIVAQCKAAGVACFVKQLGSVPVMDESLWRTLHPTPMLNHGNAKIAPDGSGIVPLFLSDRKGGTPSEWFEDLRVRETLEARA